MCENSCEKVVKKSPKITLILSLKKYSFLVKNIFLIILNYLSTKTDQIVKSSSLSSSIYTVNIIVFKYHKFDNLY